MWSKVDTKYVLGVYSSGFSQQTEEETPETAAHRVCEKKENF